MQLFVVLSLMFFLGSASSVLAFARKPSSSTQPAAAKKYACPMQCEIHKQPGKCPKCGMEMWEVSS